MITVDASGVPRTRQQIEAIMRQIPFATALALTRTAQLTKDEIEANMRTVFDRPTSYTLRALRLFPATKKNLTAKVWMKNEADKASPATKWLNPQIDGGRRQDKRSESALRARGVLAGGRYIAPGKDARLNGFGNISRGTMQKILSGLGAQSDDHQNSTDSDRSSGNKRAFFVLGRGADAVGIAQRTGKRSTKLLLAFIKRPAYSQLLDFYGIGNRVIARNLNIEMEKALRHAIETANR